MRLFLIASMICGSGLALGFAPARAADPVVADDDDDDFFKEPAEGAAKKGNNEGVPDASSFEDPDDFEMPTFTAAPVAKAAPDAEKDLSAFADPRNGIGSSTKMPVDTMGKDVLGDNWSPSVVIADKDAVVVEVPVLYGRNRAEFDGVAYWLVAEVYADGKKVAESRMQVTRDAIADKGPSIQFFRMFAPVPAAAGMLEVRVGKSASAAGKPVPLFVRSVNYKT